jgi:hypothetical protein
MATEMRRLGARVGTVAVKVEIQWPIYAEHVDFMREGSILILMLRMVDQIEKEAKRQILAQLRAIAHADGWTPEKVRDRFMVCESPVEEVEASRGK